MEAASIATLAVTALKVSVSLYELINNIKDADTNLSDLSKEVKRFTDLLQSIEKVIKQCQPHLLTLAHLDDHIWQQIKNTLADCKVNIEGLNDLVNRLSSRYDPTARSLSKVLNKSTLFLHSEFYSDDIARCTDKIYKSNCAMQTALVVVNVSLSFRTNVSQDTLLRELEDLKRLIRTSLEAVHRDEITFRTLRTSTDHQNNNLKNLARAAIRFHSSASSTASTLYGGEPRPSGSIWGGSEGYGLTEIERERIEEWNELATVNESEEDSMTEAMTEATIFSGLGDTSTTITSPETESQPQNLVQKPSFYVSEEEDDSEDDEVEQEVLGMFEKLALKSFAVQDYSKAEQCLRRILDRQTNEASAEDHMKLRVQLSLSCCLQEKWDDAAEVISLLPKTATLSNLPVFDLLQAVTLALLQGNRLADAFRTCKAVLRGKKKIMGRHSHDYYEGQSILATIYEKSGDSLEAEVVRHLIPLEWTSQNADSVQSPQQFIMSHASLSGLIFPKGKEEELIKDMDEPAKDEGNPLTSLGTITLGSTTTLDASTSIIDVDPAPEPSKISRHPIPSYLGPIERLGSSATLPTLGQVRIRWTVRKDMGNIRGPRPFEGSGRPQLLPSFRATQEPEACHIAIMELWSRAGRFALCQGSSVATCIQAASTYENRSLKLESSSAKDVLRKTRRQGCPMGVGYTTSLLSPRNWLQELGPKELAGESVKYFSYDMDVAAKYSTNMRWIERDVASLIAQRRGVTQVESFTPFHLDGLIYALPDFTYRLDWKIITDTLTKSPLLQHARIIPRSIAVVHYYLNSGALALDELGKDNEPKAIVVLNCEDYLVDCSPYLAEINPQGRIKIIESQTSYMAEVAGLDHASDAFKTLLHKKLPAKYGLATSAGRSHYYYFLRILRLFELDGEERTVVADIQMDTSGEVKQEKLTFSHAELLECFAPSVAMVRKMLEETVGKLVNYMVSHVLVAGNYQRSKYLMNELQQAVNTLRPAIKGTMKLLSDADCQDICTLGALSHAISC
ncbi:Fc.00g083670.m01.CDS01 [Cosmosporella sp. VM-42]